jgi:MFS family permease
MTAVGGSDTAQKGRTAALVAALLGWLFDGFEMGLFPLVGPRALEDLLAGPDGKAAATAWFGSIMAVFLVGAACGGVLFGWLGDRIGRVRAMSLSILTYAIFTGLCGLARTPLEIAAARFIASLGMGGEWALGVALVSELWPDASRPLLAGLIGAAANAGYLLVALVSIVLTRIAGWSQGVLQQAGLSADTVEWLTRGDAWRLLMMAGAVPGLLVFFIRMAVPESARWEDSRAAPAAPPAPSSRSSASRSRSADSCSPCSATCGGPRPPARSLAKPAAASSARCSWPPASRAWRSWAPGAPRSGSRGGRSASTRRP